MTAPFRRDQLRRRSFLRDPPLPSLNFLVLCLLFFGSGAALWQGLIVGRGAVMVFVLSGWVVSLCLHEFGHAVAALRGGDHSVAQSGYLDLDPLRYADPMLSILLPLFFLLIGGIGLPGGAIWIDHAALRSRLWEAGVAAAGPLANLLCLLALAGLAQIMPDDTPAEIGAAMAALAYIQATAIVLNLLPIPGLDGFGIIRPFLPGHVAAAGQAIAAGAGFLLILLVLMSPPVSRTVFGISMHMTDALGFDPFSIIYGLKMLKLF